MKFIIKLVLIAGLGYLLQQFFPFWILAFIAFIISLAVKTGGTSSFFAGLFAGTILWGYLAQTIDSNTNSILTDQISALFSLPGMGIILITAIVGGLISGFSAMTGSFFASMFERKHQNKYYS